MRWRGDWRVMHWRVGWHVHRWQRVSSVGDRVWRSKIYTCRCGAALSVD